MTTCVKWISFLSVILIFLNIKHPPIVRISYKYFKTERRRQTTSRSCCSFVPLVSVQPSQGRSSLQRGAQNPAQNTQVNSKGQVLTALPPASEVTHKQYKTRIRNGAGVKHMKMWIFPMASWPTTHPKIQIFEHYLKWGMALQICVLESSFGSEKSS